MARQACVGLGLGLVGALAWKIGVSDPMRREFAADNKKDAEMRAEFAMSTEQAFEKGLGIASVFKTTYDGYSQFDHNPNSNGWMNGRRLNLGLQFCVDGKFPLFMGNVPEVVSNEDLYDLPEPTKESIAKTSLRFKKNMEKFLESDPNNDLENDDHYFVYSLFITPNEADES